MGDWRTMGHAQRRRQGAPSVAAAAAVPAQERTAQPSLEGLLSGMESGDQQQFMAGRHTYGVRYDSQQSYGDDNRPVRGAVAGVYTVTYPNGGTTGHYHGPHALTEQARKRGANPNAKQYAAGKARDAIVSHAMRNR